jgi:restriction endonuclease S subunit
MKFEVKTLKEISGGGSYGLGASAEQTPVGPKFLRTTDIVSGTIDWDAVPYCEADAATIDKYRLHANDIVISRTGANAGINCIVTQPPDNAIFAGYLVRFQIDERVADSHFVSYVLRSAQWADYVANTRTGSAQPQLNAVLMGNFSFPLPPLGVQTAISRILKVLDDKIEVNKSVSRTMEEIAQAIFKSWFIDFDPVKAKMAGEKPVGMDGATAALFSDSMEDSSVGQIPAGWKLGTLEDACLILDSKRIPLSGAERKKRPGNFPYYGATGVLDFVDDYLFEGPHVLVGEDGSVVTKNGTPFVQYVWGRFWVSNHAHVLRGVNGFSVEQLKLFLDRVQISNYVTGAVQPKLNQGNLKSIPCLLPNVQVCEAFNLLIGPMFDEIRLLSEQTKSLVEIRDRLLPRLVSGELHISEEMLVS